jgi:membrane protease YdiL (CAAX protease family)
VIHFGSSLLALLTGRIPAIEITAPNATIAIIPIAALLEEIGWRGFALRRLLDHTSPFAATLMIGVPWALLHFALFVFFVPDVSPVAEGLTVLVFAFPLTWVFVRSVRNVLVATVAHSALNAFALVSANIPPAEVLWFVFASGCLVVAAIVAIDRRRWFARPAETTVGVTIQTGVPSTN